jgi:hypothetical protein
MPRSRFLLVTGVFLSAAASEAGPRAAATPSATVALALDHNRITIPLELRAAGGAARTVRAWVDTGGTTLVLTASLARALGLDLTGLPDASESSVATRVPAPAIRIGDVPLDTEGMTVSIRAGRFALPGVQADCILPARCLRRLHVVFDYPARQLTVAEAGSVEPRGTPVPCPVNPATGLFMTDATIDGEPVKLGVDTGSAGTWVSDTLTSAWLARHPDWPNAVGAAGSTNFFGFPFETQGKLVRLPTLSIGPTTVNDVAVLGLTKKLFDWYSGKSAGSVAGFVGADLLVRYRLEVDFPAQTCWWQRGPAQAWHDLSIVGLTLRPEADGSYAVAGLVLRGGRPLVEGVESGDKLVRIGTLVTLNARMGDVMDALRGRPGETRTLYLERGGKQVVVTATVVQLP